MRGMILAAGRGERMGELTTNIPKPLLRIGEHYLIDYAIASCKRAGISELIINVSYQAEQIKRALGDGERYGVSISYSEEKERLETGGGILQALPWFQGQPFIVISADIITDYPLEKLLSQPKKLAHLVMVDNPEYHQEGDFGLQNGRLSFTVYPRLTYANVGVYHPDLFAGCQPGHFRLARLLMPAITKGAITGEHYAGTWYNIGTPEDFHFITHRAREDSNLRPLASETNTLSN